MIFKLEFEYHYGQSWPLLEFDQDPISVEESSISDLSKKITFVVDIQKFPYTIKNVNKKENDTVVRDNQIVQDQVVKLKNIWAENILINLDLVINYTSFEPEYHAGYLDYCKAHTITVADSLQTHSFYFNGLFKLNFELPFWNWYARVKRPNQSGLSQQQINFYIGEIGNDQFDQLKKLKDLLASV